MLQYVGPEQPIFRVLLHMIMASEGVLAIHARSRHYFRQSRVQPQSTPCRVPNALVHGLAEVLHTLLQLLDSAPQAGKSSATHPASSIVYHALSCCSACMPLA